MPPATLSIPYLPDTFGTFGAPDIAMLPAHLGPPARGLRQWNRLGFSETVLMGRIPFGGKAWKRQVYPRPLWRCFVVALRPKITASTTQTGKPTANWYGPELCLPSRASPAGRKRVFGLRTRDGPGGESSSAAIPSPDNPRQFSGRTADRQLRIGGALNGFGVRQAIAFFKLMSDARIGSRPDSGLLPHLIGLSSKRLHQVIVEDTGIKV
jgi:hypothetical protein